MSSFAVQTATPQTTAPDPSKHVNFSVGMVLGVDDLTQEFTYLSGRDQWLARDLLGYGTVCGLKVSVDSDAKGPRVLVTSGAALSPAGQLICVRPAQCASINDWLSTNQPQLGDALGSPPGTFLRLYLTLCYRDCPVDQVPIAGEPCRTEAELMAPSRIVDDFRLDFRLTPPKQGEEDALRQFVEWLNFFEIADGDGPFLTLEQFEALVRGSLEHAGIASPPNFGFHSPLSPPGLGMIHSSDACEFLRAAYRIWVTELRPLYHAICNAKPGCCGDVKAEGPVIDECLLLAELDLSVVSLGPGQGWVVQHVNDVAINERRRPFLIHLGLLQEMLLCGPRKCCGGDGGGTTGPQGPRGFQGLQGLPGLPGKDGKDGGPGVPPSNTVAAATSFGLPAAAGVAASFSRGDHTHGTPPDPIPAHRVDVNAHTLAGDVTGPIGTVVVERLRGVVVDPTLPVAGQVLGFNAGRWQPTAVATPASAGNTVKAETAFGLPSAAGTDNNYSRADHTHGTPPAPILAGDVTGPIGTSVVERLRGVVVDPTPPVAGQVLGFNAGRWQPTAVATPASAGNTVKAETAFGLPSASGADNNYSRADHTHGTPPDPIPAHRADANAHTLVGDVTGTTGGSVVSGIQKFPVPVPNPVANNGMVLTFRPAGWALEAPSAGFVVAAGRFNITTGAAVSVTTVFSFKGLTARPFPAVPFVFILHFPAFTTAGQYVVKGTPVTQPGQSTFGFEVIQLPTTGPTAFNPADPVNGGIPVRVAPANNQGAALGFMVEISEFPNLG